MRWFKYLASLWVILLMYSALTFFNGPKGISAYKQLHEEQNRQSVNIESLKTIHDELDGNRKALLMDPDTIAAEARELGYARDTERFVRIVGLGKPMRPQYNPGQTLAAREPSFMENKTVRVIALIAGGITLVFLSIVQFLKMLVKN
jgi:cell division protein FtsB